MPSTVLLALLQRTPVVRVAASAGENCIVARAGDLLRSAVASVASLGAVHALAGATTFIAQQNNQIIVRAGDPPRVNNPAVGTAGSAIFQVVFTVTGEIGGTQPGAFQITNLPPGLIVPGLDSSGLVNASTGFINGTPTAAGTFTVTILAWRYAGGAATQNNDTFGPNTITFSISPGVGVAPTITVQPVGQSVAVGAEATFTASASGTPAPTLQWQRNGLALTGATAASFRLASVQLSDAGEYTVVAANSAGSVTSNPATLNVSPPGQTARLSNLSVRTSLPAAETLIVGVVVSGGGARNILVRAAGPALAGFGLSGAMTDPRLELYNGTTLALENDNWSSTLADTFASVGAFAFTPGSSDAAFMQAMDGPRSIQARGSGAGVVLVEAYDTGTGNSPRLINVSARNRVGTGDDILIAGFNVAGTGTKQLLIRAIGPKLAAFNVPGVLADPRLEVYSGSVKLNENDTWNPALAPIFDRVGAFQLDAGSRDAALLTSLAPGSYTVQVSGAGGGTGEALIEIYEVP